MVSLLTMDPKPQEKAEKLTGKDALCWAEKILMISVYFRSFSLFHTIFLHHPLSPPPQLLVLGR